MTTSPADIIADALKPPPGAETAQDIYAAVRRQLSGAAPDVAPPLNLTDYNADYHCQRFVIGQTMGVGEDGRKTFDETDDSVALQEVMQLRWSGKAVIANRLDTFLQDGTVVVWLEWLTPKPTKQAERPAHARTVGELLDPRVPPASAGAVPPEVKGPPAVSAQGADVLSPAGDTKFVGDIGPSYEDEDFG